MTQATRSEARQRMLLAVARREIDRLERLTHEQDMRVKELQNELRETREMRDLFAERLAATARAVRRAGWEWDDEPDGPRLTPPKTPTTPRPPAVRVLTLRIEPDSVVVQGDALAVRLGTP